LYTNVLCGLDLLIYMIMWLCIAGQPPQYAPQQPQYGMQPQPGYQQPGGEYNCICLCVQDSVDGTQKGREVSKIMQYISFNPFNPKYQEMV